MKRQPNKINDESKRLSNQVLNDHNATELKLAQLQDVYYKNNKQEKDLVPLWKELSHYSRSILLSFLKKRNFTLSSDDVYDCSMDMTIQIINRIKKWPIEFSFGCYLQMAALLAYKYKKISERDLSYDEVVERKTEWE